MVFWILLSSKSRGEQISQVERSEQEKYALVEKEELGELVNKYKEKYS